MNKTLTSISAAIIMSTVTLSGCGGAAWWQNVQNDPTSAVRSFEQSVRTTMDGAALAWPFVKGALPPGLAAELDKKYLAACAAVNHALAVLDKAAEVAVELKQDKPDFSKLLAAVTEAVGKVMEIVDTVKTAGPAPAATAGALAEIPPGLEDARSGYAALRKRTGK